MDTRNGRKKKQCN